MSETLSPSEAAHFETGGEAAIPGGNPAPTPQAEPSTPEPAAEPAEPAAPAEPRLVPFAAVHEERTRRQSIEQQLTAERTARQAEAAKYTALLERLAPQQQTPPGEQTIDKTRDPMGYLEQQIARQNSELAQLRESERERQQGQQQQTAEQSLRAWGSAQETEFTKTTPDYIAATQHLASVRDQELKLSGVTDANERAAHIRNEVLQITAKAAREGTNPAETFYGLARLRGFQAPAPAEADPLATVARGQQLAAALGNGGAAPSTRLTAEALLAMSGDDFLKATSSGRGKDLMGG